MSTGQSAGRQAVRRLQNNPDPKRNDGTFKDTGKHIDMKPIYGSPIFIPKRKKYRRSGFHNVKKA